MNHSPAVLECRGLRKRFGEARSGSRRDLPHRRGRDLRPARPQRRRQDDDDLDGVRSHPAIARLGARRRPRSRHRRRGGAPAIGIVPQELAIYEDLTPTPEPHVLRRALRRARHRAGCSGSRPRSTSRSSGPRGRSGQGPQRRHEAPPQPRGRPRPQARTPGLRRANRRRRSAEPSHIFDSSSCATAARPIIYTTHYMEEVEGLCDRIAIMDLGELKAEGTRSELVALVGEHDRVSLEGTGDLEALARACESFGPVHAASVTDGAVELIVDHARSVLADLLRAAGDAGVAVADGGGLRARPRVGVPPSDREGAAGRNHRFEASEPDPSVCTTPSTHTATVARCSLRQRRGRSACAGRSSGRAAPRGSRR